MGVIGRAAAMRIAAAALVLGGATGLSAFAASTSIPLADGTSLAVWEQRGPAVAGRSLESSLGYSVTDAAGTHLGIVPTTADASRDTAPNLAINETGSAVLVWSRFDGSYRKIAYARFSGAAWTNVHYLTFGPGNNDEPKIGIGLAGSFLFFYGPADMYHFAPLDLVAGRLFAAPRPLDLGSARRDMTPARTPGSTSIQGAVDVPVTQIIGGPGRRPIPSSGGRLFGSGLPTIQGAVDVPVTQCHTQAAIWAIDSSGDCRGMVLVIPARDLKSALVFRFADGPTSLLQRVPVPGRIVENFGADLAASYLPLACF